MAQELAIHGAVEGEGVGSVRGCVWRQRRRNAEGERESLHLAGSATLCHSSLMTATLRCLMASVSGSCCAPSTLATLGTCSHMLASQPTPLMHTTNTTTAATATKEGRFIIIIVIVVVTQSDHLAWICGIEGNASTSNTSSYFKVWVSVQTEQISSHVIISTVSSTTRPSCPS